MKQIKFEEFIKSKKFEEEVSKLKQITKKLSKIYFRQLKILITFEFI